MAIKKAIIHLGMPKAGSSSIQHILYNNASKLEEFGFKYLTEWGRNHVDIFHSIFEGNIKNQKTINTLLNVINNSDCETLVLSGEYFNTLYLDSTIKNINNFSKKYFNDNNIETTIIYYVRNPLTWITSWMSQILFSSGYLTKNADFFETAIKQYNGIFKLHEYFTDNVKVIKFEDACLDKNGFVANFLKTVKFPDDALMNIDMSNSKRNESRCMEVIEFVHFVEAMEGNYSFFNYKRYVPSRFYRDIKSLRRIKGVKFDLPFQSKVELWERFRETVKLLKESLNIDYTDYKIKFGPSDVQETYKAETIQEFIDAFSGLNLIVQKHFLKFFEQKYMETAQEKFKQLFFVGSIPHAIYKRKYSFLGLLHARKNNMMRLTKKIIDTKRRN